MKIVLDVMGQDAKTVVPVKGALDALLETDVQIVLAGREEEIMAALKECGHDTVPERMEILDAPEVVTMNDYSTVLKTKRNSSMCKGLDYVAAGNADAIVSAGSTGALLTAATLIVKRIRGVRRAALGTVLPNDNGGVLLMDCGANAECTAEYLLQFAYMGYFYMRNVMKRDNPRVALLNIGAEDAKGRPEHKEAFELLSKANEEGFINFVGNIEGRDIFTADCDVIIADGFSGNIALKTVEGTASYFAKMMKSMFYKNIFSKISALIVKGGINSLKKKMDYAEVGGSPFIGLSKPVIKAHGASNSKAFKNAIKQAYYFASSSAISDISANVENMKVANEGKTE